MLNFIWHHSQAVRQRSAKPLFPGPIPGGASKCSGLKRCRSENPRFSRVFFVFRRFPALCLRSAAFLKIRIKAKIKRCQTPISIYCAESDRWNAISGRFSESFSLRKPPFFRFSQKNIVKFLCLRKEVLRIAYIYRKEDCDCHHCLSYSKGKCKLQWCCCYQDKVRTGSPFTSNMKIIIKRRKEQHDQLKNQN